VDEAGSPETKLDDLRHCYSFGEDLTLVVRYFKAFNFVALATLIVSILPINGILPRRATTVQSVELTSPLNILINPARQFPNGYIVILICPFTPPPANQGLWFEEVESLKPALPPPPRQHTGYKLRHIYKKLRAFFL